MSQNSAHHCTLLAPELVHVRFKSTLGLTLLDWAIANKLHNEAGTWTESFRARHTTPH